MKIRVAGITRESVVDGPGIRMVIFGQGCPRHCNGCHNPEAIDVNGGEDTDVEKIIEIIKKHSFIQGVTLSGGEPFLQADAMAAIANAVQAIGKNVVTFTGYTLEELFKMVDKGNKGAEELLFNTNILIDGPFIIEQKSLNLPFRGSSNQRLLKGRESLERRETIEYKLPDFGV